MSDEAEQSRFTFWRIAVMLAATLVALFIGFIGVGLWMSNAMTFAPVLDAEPNNGAAWAAFLFLSAGPVFAAAGLLSGWISFLFFSASSLGWKLALGLPLLWAVGVVLFVTFATAVCSGSFTCGF